MGKGLALGTLLGGIIVFVWMMVSWMVLPWHCTAMNQFKDEAAVAAVVMENTEEDGVYVLPSMCGPGSMEEHMAATRKGPVMFAAVRKYGADMESPAPYIIGFIITLLSAFLITYLWMFSGGTGYWRGVGFFTLVGLVVGVVGGLPNWNWWGFSIEYVGVEILDSVIAWFLAGLVISGVAKRRA